MGMDRRGFIKATGAATLVGLTAQKTAKAQAEQRLPEETPKHGERWAMVIDVEKCKQEKNCTKCIDACHVVHNVPDFPNPKDEIKWIWKESFEHVFEDQENEFIPEEIKHLPIPLLCNHCDNPPCVKVCPTKATWQREDGIVMMDWHRCIGCRYCVAACPYGSRSFNWRDPRGTDKDGKPFIKEIQADFPTRMRGVVEKCTFCDERLAKGEEPACVAACTCHALVFGDLEDPDSEVRHLLESRLSVRRKPVLGTQPEVYYLLS